VNRDVHRRASVLQYWMAFQKIIHRTYILKRSHDPHGYLSVLHQKGMVGGGGQAKPPHPLPADDPPREAIYNSPPRTLYAKRSILAIAVAVV
jgi:hypothetical protein